MRLTLAAMLLNLGAPVAPIYAGPDGATVVTGQVDIQQQGNLTEITASNNAIIDFVSFNIAQQETVRFIQPSETARVLNRVMDGNATQIDGSLFSNGHVYLLNPAGIFFGDTAIVSMGHLTAAAGTITSQDFLAGIDQFSAVTGPVINAGSIEANAINLIGSRVANLGSIVAPEGLVTLTAGEDVYLGSANGGVMVQVSSSSTPDLEGQPAVSNPGTIDAPGGRIMMGAADVYALAATSSGSIRAADVELRGEGGRVEVAGSIDATNNNGTGGTVHVLGDQVAIRSGASIDTSGSTGGGEINIGGSYQGKGPLPNASRTLVEEATLLVADAMLSGDGGEIIVWSDEVTGYYGHLSARGGELGGNGGFAEVSGKQSLLLTGTADLLAPNGNRGTLLLDPKNGTVDATGGTAITGDRLFNDNPSGNETYLNTDIVALLDGADLILAFNNDFTINNTINASGNASDGSLIIFAGRNISINADVIINGDFLATANATTFDGVNPANRDAGAGGFSMAFGTTIDTTGADGDIEIYVGRGVPGATSGDLQVFDLSSGNGDIYLEQFGPTAGSDILIDGTVETVAGDFDALALGLQFSGNTSDINLAGNILTSGGFVALDATGNILMEAASSIEVIGSGVELQAGILGDNGGISMADGATITADGTIDLFATADIALGRIVSNDPFPDAIVIATPSGQIIDNGDTGGADIETTSTGGGAHITAASIVQIDLAVDALHTHTEAANGSQEFTLISGINVAQIADTDSFSLRAGTGDITFDYLTGGIFDTDNALDIVADSLTVSGSGDFGASGNPINIESVSVDTSGVGGSVFTDFAVSDVFITGPVTQTGTFFASASGNLTVDAQIIVNGTSGNIILLSSQDITINQDVVTQGTFGNITIHADGNLNINSQVASNGPSGSLDLSANGDITLNSVALISTQSGFIDLLADAEFSMNPLSGSIVMDDGSLVDGGNGEINITAAGNITISQLMTTSTEPFAIEVESTAGSILDGGDTGGDDIVAPMAGVALSSRTGIGTFSDDLELDTSFLEVFNLGNAGSIDLTITPTGGNLSLGEIINFGAGSPTDFFVSAGNVFFEDRVLSPSQQFFLSNSGNIVVNESILSTNVLLQAATGGAGQLSFGVPGLAIGANSISLVAGAGGGTGTIDAETNAPHFLNTLGDEAPTTFSFIQQLDINTGAATFPTASQFGPFGSLDGINLTLESRAGSVNLAGTGPDSLNILDVTAAILISLAGDTSANTVLFDSEQDITIDAALTTTGGNTDITAERSIAVNSTGSILTDGGDITLTANPSGTTTGNFTAILIDGGTIAALSDGSGGNITLNGTGGNTGVNIGVQIINLATVQTESGGSIDITGTTADGSGSNNHGVLIASGATVQGLDDASITINATVGGGLDSNHAAVFLDAGTMVTTEDGNITIDGTAVSTATGTTSFGVDIFEAEISSDSGNIDITGQGALNSTAINHGVRISTNALLQTTSGDITVTGTGGGNGTADQNNGIFLFDAPTIQSASGNILLDGTAGDGTTFNMGVRAASADVTITNDSGNITILGMGGGSSTSNHGIGLNTTTLQTNTGNITLNGTASSAATGGIGVDIFFLSTSNINTADGAISITGTGAGTGAGNHGVSINGGPVTADGTGTITIIGNGSTNTTGAANGVVFSGGAVVGTNSGNFNITGTAGGVSGTNSGITTAGTGTTLETSSGTLTLIGTGADTDTGAGGIFIGTNTTVQTDDGSLIITGTGGATGTDAVGVEVNGGDVLATGIGSITITGNGGGDADFNHGVLLTQTGTTISVVNGDLDITGIAGGTTSNNSGIDVDFNVLIESTGTGDITLSGTGNGSTPVAGNFGIFFEGGGNTLTSIDGDITLNGTGALTDGIRISSNTTIESTNTATITLDANGAGNSGNISIITGSTLGSSAMTGSLSVVADGSIAFTSAAVIAPGATFSSGQDGTGDITVTTSLSNFNVDDITFSAGDTSGSATIRIDDAAAFFATQNGTAPPIFFSIAQDGDIDTTFSLPAISDFAGTGSTPDQISLLSRNGSVTVNEGTRLANSTLDLFSFTDITFSSEITNSDISANAGQDLFVDAPIGGLTLSLIAQRSITITDTVAGFNTSIEANSSGTTSGNFVGVTIDDAIVSAQSSLIITGNGGDIGSVNHGVLANNNANLSVSNGGTIDITGTAGAATGFNNVGVFFDSGARIQATDALITINGQSNATGSRSSGVVFNDNSDIQFDTGTLSIEGIAGNGTNLNTGVELRGVGTEIFSNGGDIFVVGNAGNGSAEGNIGIHIDSASLIQVDGAGTLSLTGTGGTGTDSNIGILITDPGFHLRNDNGDLTLTGSASNLATGNNNIGIEIRNEAIIESIGSGTIELIGSGGGGQNTGAGISLFDGGSIFSEFSDITLTGSGGNGSGTENSGVIIFDAGTAPSLITASNNANISITGTSGASGSDIQRGVVLAGDTLISAVDGSINITGTADGAFSLPNNAIGVNILGDAIVQATADGNILIQGFGGNGGDFAHGILTQGFAAIISNTDNITLLGTGGSGGEFATGITLGDSTLVQSSGTIIIQGTGGTGTSFNRGVVITGVSAVANDAPGGTINITGTGGINATGTNNEGLAILTTGSILSDGPITINALKGANTNTAFGMADGTVVSSGSGNIVVNSDGNFVVSALTSLSIDVNAIDVNLTAGSIIDAGDNAIDFEAPSGRVALSAVTGIGDSNQIEIRANSVDLTNTTTGNLEAHLIDVVNVFNITQNAPAPFITNITNENSGGPLNILISNLNLSGNATIAGSDLADTFTIDADLTNVTSLTINAGDGNDRLTIDFNFDITTITFNGEGGNDDIILNNGNFDTVSYTFDNASDGRILIDNSTNGTINFTGLEPIIDNIVAENRVFTFSNADDVITLGDNGSMSDGLSRISSLSTSELVDFIAPTDTLTIKTLSATTTDQITITPFDSTAASPLFLRVEALGDLLVPSADSLAGLNLVLLSSQASQTLTTGALNSARQIDIASAGGSNHNVFINGTLNADLGIIIASIDEITFDAAVTGDAIFINNSVGIATFNDNVTTTSIQQQFAGVTHAFGDFTVTNGLSDITFTGKLVLENNVTVTANDITFTNQIDSDSNITPRILVLNSSNNGVTTLLGNIGVGANNAIGGGDDRPLFRIETNADGITKHGYRFLLTDGSTAQFDDAAQLTANINITELGPGNVVFGSTLDSAPGTAFDITVDTPGGGDTVFAGTVGGSQPLGSITTDAAGQVIIGSNVTTVNEQLFNDQLVLNNSVTLTGSAVNTPGGVDAGANTLTVAIVEPPSNNNNGSIAESLPDQDNNTDDDDAAAASSSSGSSSTNASASSIEVLSTTLAQYNIALPEELRDQRSFQTLQSSYNTFLLTQLPGSPFNAQAYVAFLRSAPEEQATINILAAVRTVLDELDRQVVNPDERRAARRRILETLTPQGLTPDQFEAVIQQLQPQPAVPNALNQPEAGEPIALLIDNNEL